VHQNRYALEEYESSPAERVDEIPQMAAAKQVLASLDVRETGRASELRALRSFAGCSLRQVPSAACAGCKAVDVARLGCGAPTTGHCHFPIWKSLCHSAHDLGEAVATLMHCVHVYWPHYIWVVVLLGFWQQPAGILAQAAERWVFRSDFE
jgi:hypothetical protein